MGGSPCLRISHSCLLTETTKLRNYHLLFLIDIFVVVVVVVVFYSRVLL